MRRKWLIRKRFLVHSRFARTLSARLRSVAGRGDRRAQLHHRALAWRQVIDRVDATGVIRTVAMLGNHMPRQCGIATFTTHLADALTAEFPAIDGFVLAMNDPGRRHAYPSRVRFEIAETDLDSYRRAADF